MNGKRLRAAQMLVVANAFWGLSFPVMKAMQMVHQPLLPAGSSWFVASSTIFVRFLLASLIMSLLSARTLHQLTRLEIGQGLGLGLFATAGLILQMDGLAYTSASTSAFLTQFYCLIIPVWVAISERRWPSKLTVACSLLVLAGVALLSEIVALNWSGTRAGLNTDWLRLGRGELETLLASTIFTGQILWLQRPKFAPNNVNHFSLVMFATITVASLPAAVLTAGPAQDWLAAYRLGSVWVFTAVLTGFCTLGAYVLMNRWQPLLSATQAGLLYCLEPVFASVFALFLPAWLSALAGIQYPNEQLGFGLIAGGSLITIANALMSLGERRAPERNEPPEPRTPALSSMAAAMPVDSPEVRR
jgi:drug/metabolite transporter (DMT)-like permease